MSLSPGEGTARFSRSPRGCCSSDKMLAILPLGTLNGLARDLQLPLDVPTAIQQLPQARTARHRRGRGQRPGVPPQRHHRPRARHRRGPREGPRLRDSAARSGSRCSCCAGWRAPGALRSHCSSTAPRMCASSACSRWWSSTIPTTSGSAASWRGGGSTAGGSRPTLSAICRLSDAIRLAFEMVMGTWGGDRMIEYEKVQQLTVMSKKSRLSVSMDGDVLSLETPLHFSVRPKSLIVLAPPVSGRRDRHRRPPFRRAPDHADGASVGPAFRQARRSARADAGARARRAEARPRRHQRRLHAGRHRGRIQGRARSSSTRCRRRCSRCRAITTCRRSTTVTRLIYALCALPKIHRHDARAVRRDRRCGDRGPQDLAADHVRYQLVERLSRPAASSRALEGRLATASPDAIRVIVAHHPLLYPETGEPKKQRRVRRADRALEEFCAAGRAARPVGPFPPRPMCASMSSPATVKEGTPDGLRRATAAPILVAQTSSTTSTRLRGHPNAYNLISIEGDTSRSTCASGATASG